MTIALRTVLFTILVPGTLTLLLPAIFLRSGWERIDLPCGPCRFLGFVPIALGMITYAWCAQAFVILGHGTPAPFDPPTQLVTGGPFRYVRNPIYLAVVSVLAGEAVLSRSGALLLYALLVLVAFHLRVVYVEESSLVARFGAEYERYRRKTPRWIPRRRAAT